MTDITNRFKQALLTGQKQVGIWNGIPHSYAAEILAGAGFDWVLIDAEHAPFSIDQIVIQLQAMSRYSAHPIVRLPEGNPSYMKTLMDAGVQSFIIPMVEDLETAQKIVAASRYAPEGIRGVGTALSRAAQWNRVNDYFKNANDQMCVIAQIESIKGVEIIDQILEVEGLDVIFIGPADLASTMGYLGNPGHEAVKEKVHYCLERIVSSGKVAGVLTSSEALIANYIEKGAKMVGVGLDTIILAKASQQLALKYIDSLENRKSNTQY